jgi:uncharacterized protein YecE (DUF72 family)
VPDAKIYAGTSGFSYPSWKPGFYPKEVPTAKFLNYYATRLNLVEINYTFRQLGKASVFEKWVEQTPLGFVFSPKAHNAITHRKKLNDAVDFTRTFLESLEPFRAAGRLGPILFQLPPQFKANADTLREFVRVLPERDRYAFEFRDKSWFCDEIYSLLRDHNICLCLAENEELETPQVFTASFAYYRLRKPEYSDDEIGDLAGQLTEHRANNRDAYALFKHEESPAGALYAQRLLNAVAALAS